MKPKLYSVAAVILLTISFARGQGSFIYDQQSMNLIEGVLFIQSDQPMGQSFTPTLSSVGFVQLYLYDGDVFNNAGGTVYVNLRANSITGPILGATGGVFMPHGFYDITNFFFSTAVAVTPGVTYYLQPVAEPGSDGFGSFATDGSYTGGSAIGQGLPIADRNLWFREGIVVPEPSSAVLLLVGAGIVIRRRRMARTAVSQK